MKFYPAIDIFQGQCVRLYQGDYDQVTEYSLDLLQLATDYQQQNADALHLVDLDAARSGSPENLPLLKRLVEGLSIPVQTGGGVRNSDDIARRIDIGVKRVVIGSLACSEPNRFIQWMSRFGSEQLVAALDVNIDGQGTPWPYLSGWTQRADLNLWQLLDQLVPAGLRHLLVTDIGRDGTLQGSNNSLYKQILQRYPNIYLQASGGIGSLQDIQATQATGASAVICGKALLDGRFTLEQAIASLSSSEAGNG